MRELTRLLELRDYDLVDDINKVPSTWKTTLMMKNIPSHLGRNDILRILDVHYL
jgi:hypothetical protein